MKMEQNAHPTDLLPAYALDILEAAEQAEVEAHLESCPECRAEVAAYRNVSNLLAGVLLIREGEPTGTLIVHGLPWLEPERQYQLWLVNDDGRVSGAVFSVEAEGFTSVEVSAPEPLPSYYRFGITIEPAGGSPGPTGDGVLRSSVDD
jgi:anti-sigma-K factor RskA